MPKSNHQKKRILYIMRFLLELTDQEHFLTVQQMIEMLDEVGIPSERKSIYDDLHQLSDFGFDIVYRKGKYGGYRILSRDFELPELKLLVDSIQASRFVTQKKSAQLIEKLERLTSVHQAKQLKRQVFTAGSHKTINENIYYNVDQIHAAIAQNRQIQFLYFTYTIEKEQEFRHGGRPYRISPFALIWNNENYYLLGYDKGADLIKHYRVDRMSELKILKGARLGEHLMKENTLEEYSRSTFSMFGGTEQLASLRFRNSLIDVVIDRFGTDITIIKDGKRHFIVHVRVVLSPQFYGWVFALGGGVQILSPEEAVQGMANQLLEMEHFYQRFY